MHDLAHRDPKYCPRHKTRRAHELTLPPSVLRDQSVPMPPQLRPNPHPEGRRASVHTASWGLDPPHVQCPNTASDGQDQTVTPAGRTRSTRESKSPKLDADPDQKISARRDSESKLYASKCRTQAPLRRGYHSRRRARLKPDSMPTPKPSPTLLIEPSYEVLQNPMLT